MERSITHSHEWHQSSHLAEEMNKSITQRQNYFLTPKWWKSHWLSMEKEEKMTLWLVEDVIPREYSIFRLMYHICSLVQNTEYDMFRLKSLLGWKRREKEILLTT